MPHRNDEGTPSQPEAGRFTLDGAATFQGTHVPGVTWNGFACPAFDLDVVAAIASHLAAVDADLPVGERLQVQVVGDRVIVTEGGDDPYSVLPDDAGRYPVGAGAWTWSLIAPGES